jgi:hypothetical protein
MLLLSAAWVFFSFLILYIPEIGAFTLVAWTALALIVIGLFYFFLGIHLRNSQKLDQGKPGSYPCALRAAPFWRLERLTNVNPATDRNPCFR